MPDAVALEIRSISKTFSAVRALDRVSLTFRRGEIHGIVGENGAGKSTLMRILAGLERPDGAARDAEGTAHESGDDAGHGILLEGQRIFLRSVRDGLGHGIAMIHQELNLVGDLTIAENIALGREPGRMGVISTRAMAQAAKAALAELGSDLPPHRRVSSLSVAEAQLVEIAKALAQNARILIMDEPTAVLSERETTALFALVRRLALRGATVLYISHLLPEVLSLCDRISVLRDGTLVATVRSAEVDERKLASLMVGRDLKEVYPPRMAPPAAATAALRVEGLSVAPRVRSVSFEVAPGEILGLAGLVGSGRTETAEAIVGLRPSSGTIEVGGKASRFSGPREALAAGVAYVSEDRKLRGIHLAMSSVENVTIAHLGDFGRMVPSRTAERAAADRWIARFAVRCPRPQAPIRTLSGGNQQKLAVAKWLDALPQGRQGVLLLDEPTRGVDLGAKREMYRIIADLAAQGLACVVISSELPELLGLCHRIAVMREGAIVGTLSAADATEDAIMHLAAGVHRPQPTSEGCSVRGSVGGAA